VLGFNLSVIAFLAVAWAVMMAQPYGWLSKYTPLYGMEVGLFHIKFGHGLAGKLLTTAAVGVKDQVEAMRAQKQEEAIMVAKERHPRLTIMEFREYACHYENLRELYIPGLNDLCYLWTVIQAFSMMLVVAAPLAFAFFFAGGVADYYYHKVHARRRGRKLIAALYAIAPIFLTVSLIMYMFGTQFLVLMKPINNGFPYGTYTYLAFLSCFFAFAPLIMHLFMTRENMDEIRNENLSGERKFIREYGDLLEYGAAAQQQQQQAQAFAAPPQVFAVPGAAPQAFAMGPAPQAFGVPGALAATVPGGW